MQTKSFLLFRLQESGLGSQDIFSEKPWKLKKKYAGIIFASGEKSNICFVSNHPFQAFFPFTPGYPQDPGPHEDFCPDPDPKPW